MGAVITTHHIKEVTGITYDELSNELSKENSQVQMFKYLMSDLAADNGSEDSYIKVNSVPMGVEVVIDNDHHYLVVGYKQRLYAIEDGSIYFQNLIEPVMNEAMSQGKEKIEVPSSVLMTVQKRMELVYDSDEARSIINDVKETQAQTVQDYVKELAEYIKVKLGMDYEWDFQTTEWLLKFKSRHIKDVLILPYLEDVQYRDNESPDKYQYIFSVKEPILTEQVAGQILQLFISLLLVGHNGKNGVNKGNKVSYAIGKPIVLEGDNKREYRKRIKEYVEDVLSDFTAYYRTEYRYSNTTSSVYLTIKFKTCYDLHISLRDHGKSQYTKYKNIIINQNQLEEFKKPLHEIVTQHIKEAKFI